MPHLYIGCGIFYSTEEMVSFGIRNRRDFVAIFSNQATLTYNGNTTNSNIAYGELLDVLTASKTAVEGTYTAGDTVTYVVTLRNTGTAPLAGLTVTDDLGSYAFGTSATLYPLTYVSGSMNLFINGVLQPTPTVTAGPPLTITPVTIPAGGDAVLVYQAQANEFADPSQGGSIINVVTISGDGLAADATATATVTADAEPQLAISKSISPSQVTDNDRISYTFILQNSGSAALEATDNAIITDVFDPRLSALSVTYNGAAWTEGVQYAYDTATGLFTTLPGALAVDAATVTQSVTTGAYTITPGLATLVVTGTI